MRVPKPSAEAGSLEHGQEGLSAIKHRWPWHQDGLGKPANCSSKVPRVRDTCAVLYLDRDNMLRQRDEQQIGK